MMTGDNQADEFDWSSDTEVFSLSPTRGLCCEASRCVNAGFKMLFGGGTRLVVETCK